jgi:anthranilate phosphoribosyltransferase
LALSELQRIKSKTMKDILNKLFSHYILTKEEAKSLLLAIGKGEFDPLQIASFLTVFNLRSLTVAELAGFREAMLELCIKVDLSDFDAVDIVGTGGDGKDTFNISTTAALVVAGAGYKVAKHGNYGVSSSCGSSNVLEYLGIKFSNDQDQLKQSLDKAGFCMMHAPLFHPAMKYVAPIRKTLQIRTFFNILGPLINPSFPKKHCHGVYNLATLRLYAYQHKQTNDRFSIVHSLDGYDEISLTSDTKIYNNQGEFMYSPNQLGFQKLSQQELWGGASIAESANILKNILQLKGTAAQHQAVIANAALAITVADSTKNYTQAKDKAEEALASGKAMGVLKTLVELS